MLITDTEQQLYRNVNARWKRLEAWLADHQSVTSDIAKSLDGLRQHWKSIDKWIMTDPNELQGACMDLDTAENYVVEKGYPKSVDSDSWWDKNLGMAGTGPGAAYGSCPHPEELQSPVVRAVAQAVVAAAPPEKQAPDYTSLYLALGAGGAIIFGLAATLVYFQYRATTQLLPALVGMSPAVANALRTRDALPRRAM